MATDVIEAINFFSHTTDGCPGWMDVSSKLGHETSNLVWVPTPVTIHDLRGKEDTLDLDVNGFEIHKYEGRVHDQFDDNSEEQKCYYDEIVDVLKKRLNASRVIIFNHRTRFRAQLLPADQCDYTHRNPFHSAHIDNDPCSARQKLIESLGEEEAKEALEKPFQLINVWRPLGPNPITNNPLTFCDFTSLDVANEVHTSEVRGSAVAGSFYVISHNNEGTQKWCYLSEMTSNEMFIFKIFDTKSDVAPYAPHTAFANEHAPKTNGQQLSIEMHCLVLYDQ